MHNLKSIRELLKTKACPVKAAKPLFFKTGPGEYSEHDQFLGVSVPDLRIVAKAGASLSLEEIQQLLESPFNEERALALMILTNRYQKGESQIKEEAYHFYMQNLAYVNNWNLVDGSAPGILGAHLYNGKKDVLETLARSNILWERRIAILATHYFIKQDDFAWTLKLAKILLDDPHDLIHKAVGWMLREVGKREEKSLRQFLDLYAAKMPRTMLRYAIERFPPDVRSHYLNSA